MHFEDSDLSNVCTSADYACPLSATVRGSYSQELFVWLRSSRLTILSKVRTATPVGPLDRCGFASSPQAVPAISRCAQESPSANSFRNAAAVIVPAFRPPTFLMSAISDLICFEYSLSKGNCQNFSPTSLPAPMISSIKI